MNIPHNLFYTKSHEWVSVEGGSAKTGLTDFAQEQLGDLVFVNLPAVGDELIFGEAYADVESVKAVSDVYSPVTGTVKAINVELLDNPALINEAPYDAWLAEIENVTEQGELMSDVEYEAFCAEQE